MRHSLIQAARAMRCASVCILILLASACDDRAFAPMHDDAGDYSRDADAPDAVVDAGGDDAGAAPLDCAAELSVDRTFAVDPGGLDTQIHASAAFDGAGAWIAYAAVEEGDTGYFDIWAVRLRCDGTPALAPFRVNTHVPFNDADPEVSVGPERLIVSWTSDDNTGGTDNMHAFHRVFAHDGTPVGDDVELRTSREGAPAPDNHLARSVLPDADGFTIAGFRAVDAAMRFQVFVQTVDADGALASGDAIEPFFEPMVGQRDPTLARTSDGTTWITWERDVVGEETQVFFTTLGGAPPAVVLPALATTAGAALSVDAVNDAYVYSAFSAAVVGTALDVRLTDLGRPEAERPVEVLGARGRDDFGARIVPHPAGGAAIAYYRNVRGLDNELVLQRFAYDGTAFTMGTEVVVSTVAAPYQPALTHVIDDVWLTSWSEGDSPDFTLHARFVTLPSP